MLPNEKTNQSIKCQVIVNGELVLDSSIDKLGLPLTRHCIPDMVLNANSKSKVNRVTKIQSLKRFINHESPRPQSN